MWVHVPVGAYMNVGECGSQKSASGVVPQQLSPLFLETGSPIGLEHAA